MKAISYSLFGYNCAPTPNSFNFETYLRGLSINIMLNKLLYPNWVNVVNMDQETYSAWGNLIKSMGAEVYSNSKEPLCKMMLWRLKPVYEKQGGAWKYDHVICRDTDSPPTYREVQAVQQWINEDTSAHAITDSISHGIPMLGGMIGFRPRHFTFITGISSYDKLLNNSAIDFSKKGSDQDFLGRVVYPKVSNYGYDSITQHYFKGMPETNLKYYYRCLCDSVVGHKENCPLNIPVDGVSPDLARTNSIAGHIGAAGAYEGELLRLIDDYKSEFSELLKIQSSYPEIFYWAK